LKERRPRALLEWRSSKGLDWYRKNVQSPREVGVEFGFGKVQDWVIIGFSPCLMQRRHMLTMAQMYLGHCEFMRNEQQFPQWASVQSVGTTHLGTNPILKPNCHRDILHGPADLGLLTLFCSGSLI